MKKVVILSVFFFMVLNVIFIQKLEAAVDENELVIENGIYEIEAKIDNGKVLDISGASTLSKANVQIWERSNVYQQRFEIIYKEGYYTIKNINSGKMIDVDGAKKEEGTNVQQYISNSTDAQKWYITKTQDEYVIITSKCNSLAITISEAKKDNGANIEVRKNLNLENQKFKLKKVQKIKGSQELEDGLYTIASVLNPNMVIDISEASTLSRANVQIWEYVNVPQQKFYIKYENGYYTIRNLNSGKMLDVTNGEIAKGTNVQQYISNSTDAQKWVISRTEEGYYNIISKLSGIYLDVAGGKTENGTNVQINIETKTDKQKFIFIKIDDDNIGIINDGVYEIVSSIESNMILDVSGGSSEDGANVQIWEDANEKQQKYEITHVGRGLYKIICKRSGKALTVAKTGTSYSSNVYQSTYIENTNQLWRIVDLKEGYYSIISAYNGKYLDIQNGRTSNGTNVRVYTSNSSNSQKFSIEQRAYGIDVSHWQGTIDFKVLSDSKKIDFMILRAGQGTTIKDRQFERNYSETKKYNIPIGVYLYSTAQNVEDAKLEANYLVNLIKGKKFELPVFYDIEAHESLNKEKITQIFLQFYNIIKKSGYTTGIYASKYYFMDKIDVKKLPEDVTIWVASYGKNTGTIPNDVYKYNGKFNIWQYTSTGTIEGVKGNVDCDIIYTDKSKKLDLTNIQI